MLRSPFLVILLATLSGTATGLWWYWQAGQTLIAGMAAREQAEVEATRPEKPWDFWTVELENLTREITAQRTQLEERSKLLDEREARLARERSEVELARRQVEALQESINQQIVSVREHEQRNLKTLATTYSLLSARAAVAILNEMDDSTVAKLLSLMKPEAAAEILEELSQGGGGHPANIKRAADLSQRLRLLLPAKAGT